MESAESIHLVRKSFGDTYVSDYLNLMTDMHIA
jgi:hypothetical protein